MNAQAIFDQKGVNLATWNYRHLTASLFIGLVLQSLVLPCLCPIGTAKMMFAVVFDALILTLTLVAYLRHETGRGWIFYVILCYTSPGWIEGITYLIFGEI